MMALAAMMAGASGQSLMNSVSSAFPRQTTRGPRAAKEDTTPTGKRGVEDESYALSGDTMFALIALCRERKWVLATDRAGIMMEEDRFVLTMGASAAERGEDGGHKGGLGVRVRAAVPAPRCALTAAAAVLVCALARSVSQCLPPSSLVPCCHT